MLPVLINVGPITIYSMGFMLFWAILLGGFVVFKKTREAHMEAEVVFDVLFFSMFWALIGGRVGYILTHFSDFGFSLLKWLWISNYVGLSFYGGLIFGIGAVVYKVKQLDEDLFEWLDYLSLGLVLGMSLGLFGTFLNGSFLGRETDLFIGLRFPGWEQKLIPIQLFGALAYLIFFFWWWRMEGRYRMFEWYRGGKVSVKTGFLWFGFLIFLGFSLMLMGFFQMTPTRWMGINIDFVLALIIGLIGVIGLYLRSGRKIGEELRRFKVRRRNQYAKLER